MTPKDLPELTDVQAFQNTDREVWRETPGDFYSNSVHLTATGGLGINVGGTVYVKPPAEWHRLASGARSTADTGSQAEQAASWSAVFDLLRERDPDLLKRANTGMECALASIRKMSAARSTAAQPAGLRSAALAMVAKMDVLKPHMDALCLDSHNRGRPYKGPTYGIELEALRAAASGDSTPPSEPADGEQLWLWQNGDHFLAFRNLYPCYSPGGDPMTLGEPFGRAIFKHSHNREGKPNEQQRTDRQSPRSGADPDLQRRHTAGAGQAYAAGAIASVGHGQHPIAPQGGWSAGDNSAGPQPVPDIAGATGVLAAGGDVAQGVAVQGDPSGAPRAEPEAVGQGRWIAVTERMPENDDEVLVWVTGPWSKKPYAAIDSWHLHREDPTGMGGPTLEMGYMWREYEAQDITHWKRVEPPHASGERGD